MKEVYLVYIQSHEIDEDITILGRVDSIEEFKKYAVTFWELPESAIIMGDFGRGTAHFVLPPDRRNRYERELVCTPLEKLVV